MPFCSTNTTRDGRISYSVGNWATVIPIDARAPLFGSSEYVRL